MTIEKAVYNFIVALKIENCTPRTLGWYQVTLDRFFKWLKMTHDITDIEDLQLVYLREWINFLQETPSRRGGKRSDAYIASCSRALSSFGHWLEDEGVIEKPIMKNFKLPRVEKKFIPTFTPEDVKALFEACDFVDGRKPRLFKALASRNKAILAVLFDTGIRLKELVGLRLCDIDRERRLLLIHRKGNWWQQVPIALDGFKYLHEYLTKHRPYLASLAAGTGDEKVRLLAHKNDPVFLNSHGLPLGYSAVESIFSKLAVRAGVEGKRVSPHNCRRYMATTQLANGRSPFDVQRQMGHSTLTMTNHYASLNTEHLQKSHDIHSPLRVKGTGDNQEVFGSGYWDVE